MALSSLGRVTVILGLVLVLAGGLLWLQGRSGLPLGRRPGDVGFEGLGPSCFAPVATMILLNVLLTITPNVVIGLLNR